MSPLVDIFGGCKTHEEVVYRASVGEIEFLINQSINSKKKIKRKIMKVSTYIHVLPISWIMEICHQLLEHMATCTYIKHILSLFAL